MRRAWPLALMRSAGIGSHSQARAQGALAKAGSPDPRFDRLCIMSHSPCQTLDLLFRFRALGRADPRSDVDGRLKGGQIDLHGAALSDRQDAIEHDARRLYLAILGALNHGPHHVGTVVGHHLL